MAFGMKHWTAVVATGMAFVAVWRLPVPDLGQAEPRTTPAAQIRVDELTTEYRLTAEVLRRFRWSDSLSALAVATAENGFAFGLPPYDAAEEMVQGLGNRVRSELEALPRRAPGMVVGYYHQPNDHGSEEGWPTAFRNRVETYVGSLEGTDYCLQVRVVRFPSVTALINDAEGTDRTAPVTSDLGGCRLFALYGMPGKGVWEWLEQGGIQLGMEVGQRAEIPAESLRVWRLQRVFGWGTLGSVRRSAPVEVDQCRGGLAEACGRLLAQPRLDRELTPNAELDHQIALGSPVLSTNGGPYAELPGESSYLLWDLERDYGADAFARFWSSDAPFDEAFGQAFDESAGAWMADWVGTSIMARQPSPALPKSASSGAALTVALLVGLAYMRNRKRVVAG